MGATHTGNRTHGASARIYSSPHAQRRSLGALLLWCLTWPGLAQAAPSAEPLFGLVPPSFLRSPTVARTLIGNTYVYLANARTQHVHLMVTAMRAAAVRAQLGTLDPAQCLKLFEDELHSSHQHYFRVAQDSPLAVGAGAFVQVRWVGEKDARTETGVLACGELQGYYYIVHFADDVKSSILTFPPIRAALQALRPIQE